MSNDDRTLVHTEHNDGQRLTAVSCKLTYCVWLSVCHYTSAMFSKSSNYCRTHYIMMRTVSCHLSRYQRSLSLETSNVQSLHCRPPGCQSTSSRLVPSMVYKSASTSMCISAGCPLDVHWISADNREPPCSRHPGSPVY